MDICLPFLALVLSIIALVVAATARSRKSVLEDRLERLTRHLSSLETDLDELYEIVDPDKEDQTPPASVSAPYPEPIRPPAPVSEPKTEPVHPAVPPSTVAASATPPRPVPAQPTVPAPIPPAAVTPSLRIPVPAKVETTQPASDEIGLEDEGEELGAQPEVAQGAPPAVTQPALTPPTPPKPARKLSAEEKVVRLLIWVAAIALALTGAYLVKYSFDHGILGPGVRLAIGAGFGLVMLGVGEWLRTRYERIAQALTAAGVSVLFAVVLAGMHLEHLLPRSVGFILMAVVTALAVALSLRQGPFVAILGLIGGFATPALVGSGEHAPGQLFSYLFVLQLGLVAVTRRRQWWWMTLLTLWGGYAWVAVWLVFFFEAAQKDALWLGLFVLASAGVFALAPPRCPEEKESAFGWADVIRWCGTLVGLVLLAILLRAGGFDSWDWTFLGLLGAGCIVLARLDRRTLGLPWVALGASLAMLLVWKFAGIAPEDLTRYQWTLAALGGTYALLSYACLWGSRRPGWFASLSVLSAVAFLLLAYYTIPTAFYPHFWGLLCAGLTVAYALGAIPVYRRREAMPGAESALAALTAGASAFAMLAMPIELEREWLPVSWALLVPALALIDWKLRISMLRAALTSLVALVALWLLANPHVLTYPIGSWPVLNWILYGYGIPVVAFVLAAWVLRRSGPTLLADGIEALAAVLGAALVGLEVRHYFHRESLSAGPALFLELGSYTAAGLLVSLVLLLRPRRNPNPVLASTVDGLLSLTVVGVGLLGTVVLFNPWFNADAARAVGDWPVFNELLYVYGLPVVLLALIGWLYRRQGADLAARTSAVAAVAFLFVLVTLEVRHGFHPDNMLLRREATPDLIEWASQVAAWLVLSAALLQTGRRWATTVLPGCAQVIATFATGFACLALIVLHNPLVSFQDLGERVVLNWLLYVYGVPMLLLAGLAWMYRRQQMPEFARAMGVAAVVFLFMLVTLEVRHGFHPQVMTITGKYLPDLIESATYIIGWLVLGIALLAAALRGEAYGLPACARAITGLSLLGSLLVLLFLQNPLWAPINLGPQPVLNWLLYVYGLPMLLMAGTAWMGQRRQMPEFARGAGLVALGFLFALITLQVRDGFHLQSMVLTAQSLPNLIESATYVIAWLTLGLVLLATARRGEAYGIPPCARVITVLGFLGSFLVLILLQNPLWNHIALGDRPVWNWLLYVYAVPAVLIVLAAKLAARQGLRPTVLVGGILAILLFFTCLNLLVRHFFHHPFLDEGPWELNEMYSYSAAWVLFGVILLILGIVRLNQMLRWASLVVMGLAIVKVFAWDMAHLRDLLRVFSFLGLGVTLLVLAFLYQRFVFHRPGASEPDS